MTEKVIREGKSICILDIMVQVDFGAMVNIFGCFKDRYKHGVLRVLEFEDGSNVQGHQQCTM